MPRIIVNEFLSLDGVAQAPGGPDEDRDGGFRHGGWHMPYMDDIGGAWVDKGMAQAGGLLLGRRTYDIFAAYWPNASEAEQEIARPLNEMPKYVVSRTLKEPLAWHNSTLLHGEVAEAVANLRKGEGANLLVFGSTQLVRTLVEYGLVDEFWLMIDPVILGDGKRIFGGDREMHAYRLLESQVTGTGAILARYAPKE